MGQAVLIPPGEEMTYDVRWKCLLVWICVQDVAANVCTLNGPSCAYAALGEEMTYDVRWKCLLVWICAQDVAANVYLVWAKLCLCRPRWGNDLDVRWKCLLVWVRVQDVAANVYLAWGKIYLCRPRWGNDLWCEVEMLAGMSLCARCGCQCVPCMGQAVLMPP